MYRSPLYEIVHDYAILGEESEEQSRQYTETIQSFHYIQDTGQSNCRLEKNSSKSKPNLQQTENNIFLTKNIMGKKFSLDNVKRKSAFNSLKLHKHNQTHAVFTKQQNSQQSKQIETSKPLSKFTDNHLPLSHRSENNNPKKDQTSGVQAIINYFQRKHSQGTSTPEVYSTNKNRFNHIYSINAKPISQPKQNNKSPITSDSQQLIYNRSLNWLNQVKERVAQKQEKLTQEQIKKCTFKPQLSQTRGNSQKSQNRIRSAFNSLSPVERIVVLSKNKTTQKLSQKKNLKMKSGKENTYIQIFKDQKILYKFDQKQNKIQQNQT